MLQLVGGPAIRRLVSWTPSLSINCGSTSYTWGQTTLTLPEEVDWEKAILRVDGKSFCANVLQPSSGSDTFGVIWKPGNDGNTAIINFKSGATGAKTWTPNCELWLLDSAYEAYHLYGSWDSTSGQGWVNKIATCGDAKAAEKGALWLPNMEYAPFNSCICDDNPYVMYTKAPYRDANGNSCLSYYDYYINSNVFYSFTYAYKK